MQKPHRNESCEGRRKRGANPAPTHPLSLSFLSGKWCLVQHVEKKRTRGMHPQGKKKKFFKKPEKLVSQVLGGGGGSRAVTAQGGAHAQEKPTGKKCGKEEEKKRGGK